MLMKHQSIPSEWQRGCSPTLSRYVIRSCGVLCPVIVFYASLSIQRVVGAALDYAVDPMEVNQLDVLHVLRKNKRFLGRVTRTHGHIKHFKAKMLDTKDGLAAINNKDQQEYVFATRTFDDEAAPARVDAAAPAAASMQDASDAALEAPTESHVVSRPVIKVFRSNA